MRISSSIMLVGAMVMLAACDQASKETPSGFKFKMVKEGTGEIPRPTQFVVFNFRVTDSADSVWADTYTRGYPEFARIQDSSRIADEDGITQMLRMLSKGDSVTFKISIADLFRDFAKSPVPPEMDSTSIVQYNISVRDIVNQEDFDAYQAQVEQDYYAFMTKSAEEQLGKDTVAIDAYLAGKSIEAQKLPSGIRYVISKPGKGPVAESGQTVSVHYAGYMLDGTYFDTSLREKAQEEGLFDSAREAQNGYEPYIVTIDQTSVIPGWHEALKVLNEGAEGTFYIPSTLAYGPRANNKIKANSVLVFDLQLVDIQ